VNLRRAGQIGGDPKRAREQMGIACARCDRAL